MRSDSATTTQRWQWHRGGATATQQRRKIGIDLFPPVDFARLQREQNALIAQIRLQHAGFSGADRLSRERVHERDALR